MKNLIAATCTAVIALFASGCSSLKIVQLSPDTYMASKTSAGGIFVSMASLKAEVISAANDFAVSKGKIAIPVASEERPAVPLRNPSFEYQFRVIDKNDPEAKRTSLVPRADVVVEKTEKISADVRTKEDKAPDLYTDLTKLDDLRKKGVITEEEFATQKKRLFEKQ